MKLEPKAGKLYHALMHNLNARVLQKLHKCESPIEQMFLLALANTPYSSIGAEDDRSYIEHAKSISAQEGVVPSFSFPFGAAAIFVYQQFPCVIADRNIRLDFAAFCKKAKVAVELDGHNFHERTKEQARRDKSRDRLLTIEGWKVVRFAGSEVWADPHVCAYQVLTIVLQSAVGAPK